MGKNITENFDYRWVKANIENGPAILEWLEDLYDRIDYKTDALFRLANITAYDSTIEFVYQGSADNEEEARYDLADIMTLFRGIFNDLKAGGVCSWNGKAWGYYEMEPADLPGFTVQLRVGWVPKSCVIIEKVEKRPAKKVTTWAIACQHE